MKTTDVLIIGGSAAGMVAAVTGKSHWPKKEFTLVKKQKEMVVPCGIPYIFGTLENIDKNLMPVDAALQKSGITSLVDEAVDINTKDKEVEFLSGEKISYQRLVIATGSNPIKPKWLHGVDLENVFEVPKNKEYLDEMKVLKTKIDTFKELLPWILGGLAAIVVIILIIYYIVKRKKRQPIFTRKPKPVLPAHVVAINKLEELRLAKVWQAGHLKKYYSELTDIVREYMVNRYYFDAPEMTSYEIISKLNELNINKDAMIIQCPPEFAGFKIFTNQKRNNRNQVTHKPQAVCLQR